MLAAVSAGAAGARAGVADEEAIAASRPVRMMAAANLKKGSFFMVDDRRDAPGPGRLPARDENRRQKFGRAGNRRPGPTCAPLPVDFLHELLLFSNMSAPDRTELLQGTLDLLVLKTLAALGPLHGFGIARRIEQVSGDTVLLNQGTIYPALVRLEDQGWIGSEWGVSENNRRARFYAITAAGRKQLKEEVANWQRVAALVNAVLATG